MSLLLSKDVCLLAAGALCGLGSKWPEAIIFGLVSKDSPECWHLEQDPQVKSSIATCTPHGFDISLKTLTLTLPINK